MPRHERRKVAALGRKKAVRKTTSVAPALSPEFIAANAASQVEAGLAAAAPLYEHECEHVHAARAPPEAEATAKRPARTKTFQAKRFSDVPPAVYSISSFCVAYGISEAFYHQLQNSGRGPRELRLGNRVLITPAAADAWLAAMENETME